MYAEIARGLRDVRLNAKRSQDDVACGLPVRGRAVSEWETGAAEPILMHLIQWARELECCLVLVDRAGRAFKSPQRQRSGESWEVFQRRCTAARLRDLRISRGMPLQALAEIVGVCRDSVQRWEMLRVPPRPIAHVVWAQAFGLTLAVRLISAPDQPIVRRVKAKMAVHAGLSKPAAEVVQVCRFPHVDEPEVREALVSVTGVLLTARRRRRDMPQHRLAKLMGVSATTVSGLETEWGPDGPTLLCLTAWARLLGFRIAIVDDHGEWVQMPLVQEPGEGRDAFEARRLMVTLRWLRDVGRPRRTQAEVALMAGTSRTSLKGWEGRGGLPRTVVFIRWVLVLGCQVELRAAQDRVTSGI